MGNKSRDKILDAITSSLSGHYWCNRVWSAWGHGTMTEDDFSPSEDTEMVPELVDEIIDIIGTPIQETVGKFISVEDSLPTDDRLKVCKYKDTYYNRHMGMTLSRYYLPSNQKEKKYWCFEFGTSQPLKITHWMSLPSEEN